MRDISRRVTSIALAMSVPDLSVPFRGGGACARLDAAPRALPAKYEASFTGMLGAATLCCRTMDVPGPASEKVRGDS